LNSEEFQFLPSIFNDILEEIPLLQEGHREVYDTFTEPPSPHAPPREQTPPSYMAPSFTLIPELADPTLNHPATIPPAMSPNDSQPSHFLWLNDEADMMTEYLHSGRRMSVFQLGQPETPFDSDQDVQF